MATRHQPAPFPHAKYLFRRRDRRWIARSCDDIISHEDQPGRPALAQLPLHTIARDHFGAAVR
jgi:hypothetical protein